MRTVLVIDDNAAIPAALKLLFDLREIRTLAAESPKDGLDVLQHEAVDLVIADMNFTQDTTSGEEGVALFHSIREREPDMPVILLTAWGEFANAVNLIKAGAADYLTKPWDDVKLLAAVENLLELSEATREQVRRSREQRLRRKELTDHYDLCNTVFVSDLMERAVELACRIARASAPVLITGPNGSGKERIAQILHANSAAKHGPFIALNCGALPNELTEAELFGSEAGAFTSANSRRVGRFEAADGGTLLLDEIGNLSLSGQANLLRVLETGRFERIGSSQSHTTRARIVCATNADLPAMIRERRFREDLYYRINVVEIAVPPLSDRPDDILPLAEYFLGSAAVLSEQARAALLRHHWSGNVRELCNAIERAKLLSRSGTVEAADLGLPAVGRKLGADELDADTIARTLRECGGNISSTAQKLALSRQALYRRMERLGLRP